MEKRVRAGIKHIIDHITLFYKYTTLSFTYQITKKGHLAILSAPWYLNYLDYGADWIKMYSEDPHDFKGTNYSKQLVLGGEVSISPLPLTCA